MALKPGERVIVVGCGPVGMVLTLALYRAGIPVTLIEKNAGPIDDQRAAAIQPSSLIQSHSQVSSATATSRVRVRSEVSGSHACAWHACTWHLHSQRW